MKVTARSKRTHHQHEQLNDFVPAHVLGAGFSIPEPRPQYEIGAWLTDSLRKRSIDTHHIASVFGKSPIRSRPIASFDQRCGVPEAAPDDSWSLEETIHAYNAAAQFLSASSARAALSSAEMDHTEVTHVVLVSSTGGSVPGIDVDLIQNIGLNRDVSRTLIAGMGCSGAFYGLQCARSISLQNRGAVVLLTCVEACSVHLQRDGSRQSMVANSIFGDASASLVIASPPSRDEVVFSYGPQHSHIDPSRRDLIEWLLTDDGFRIKLSSRLPVAIGEMIEPFVRPLIVQTTSSGFAGDVESWSVHPGGTAILRRIERSLELDEHSLTSSWYLFESVGNLSSPSVLMTLALEWERCSPDTRGIMIGFGPGLALEGLTYCLGPRPPAALPL